MAVVKPAAEMPAEQPVMPLRSRRGSWGIILGVLLATVLLVGGAAIALRSGRNGALSSGKSVLANCQQIEVVKTELRATLTESLARTPSIAYYRTHPAELAATLAVTRKAIARFGPIDCYSLAAVRNAGLRPPAHR